MLYYKIESLISDSTRKQLIKYALNIPDDQWMKYKSVKSNRQTALQFFHTPYQFMDRDIRLMKMDPYTDEEWHVDALRLTALLYPLTDNYAPIKIRNNDQYKEINYPALIDVRNEHSVDNNNQIRINLQINFEEPLEEVICLFNKRNQNELLSFKI